jgi:phosphoinositide-3-kinase regulatory subunit 4
MVSIEASRRTTDRSYTNLVEVWDIENSVLMETFVTRTGSTSDAIPEPHELTGVDADTSPAAAIAALVRSRQQSAGDARPPIMSSRSSSSAEELLPVPAPDVRALVVGLDFGGQSIVHRSDFGELGVETGVSTVRTAGRGFMISGSEDRKLRLWDLGKLERTTVLSGLTENEKPSYQYVLVFTLPIIVT